MHSISSAYELIENLHNLMVIFASIPECNYEYLASISPLAKTIPKELKDFLYEIVNRGGKLPTLDEFKALIRSSGNEYINKIISDFAHPYGDDYSFYPLFDYYYNRLQRFDPVKFQRLINSITNNLIPKLTEYVELLATKKPKLTHAFDDITVDTTYMKQLRYYQTKALDNMNEKYISIQVFTDNNINRLYNELTPLIFNITDICMNLSTVSADTLRSVEFTLTSLFSKVADSCGYILANYNKLVATERSSIKWLKIARSILIRTDFIRSVRNIFLFIDGFIVFKDVSINEYICIIEAMCATIVADNFNPLYCKFFKDSYRYWDRRFNLPPPRYHGGKYFSPSDHTDSDYDEEEHNSLNRLIIDSRNGTIIGDTNGTNEGLGKKVLMENGCIVLDENHKMIILEEDDNPSPPQEGEDNGNFIYPSPL